MRVFGYIAEEDHFTSHWFDMFVRIGEWHFKNTNGYRCPLNDLDIERSNKFIAGCDPIDGRANRLIIIENDKKGSRTIVR